MSLATVTLVVVLAVASGLCLGVGTVVGVALVLRWAGKLFPPTKCGESGYKGGPWA